MECGRLQRLVKSWYAQVQDESMAPARMVSFMKTHINECPVCLADPLVRQEVEKIASIILPLVKVYKPVAEEEAAEEEEGLAGLFEDPSLYGEKAVDEEGDDSDEGSAGGEEDLGEEDEEDGF